MPFSKAKITSSVKITFIFFLFYNWLSHTNCKDTMIWGDQNKDGKTKKIFKINLNLNCYYYYYHYYFLFC